MGAPRKLVAKNKPAAKPAKAKQALQLPREQECLVRCTASTYVAQAVGYSSAAQASCTWSDAQAVRRLAAKLGYPADVDVQLVRRMVKGNVLWKIVNVSAPRSCRVCGCTDMLACKGGCYWIATDVCSRCADKADALGSARSH